MCVRAFVLILLISSLAHPLARAADTALAPGYKPLAFQLPAPGSYQLPSLGDAADGVVLDTEGREIRLHELFGDKVVLLSFIYATCDDVNGCPLSTAVFHKIQNRLRQEPELARGLRLVTLSFNPEHDTPAAMAAYGKSFNQGLDWKFLTSRSEAAIQPILAAYGQTVQKDLDAQGHPTGTFSHILRVYLVDRQQHIRNIYTVSFLHADTLVNDVQSLLLEKPSIGGDDLRRNEDKAALGPGDDKTGYGGTAYRTHAKALTEREGREANLLALTERPPLGLPMMPVPTDNPLTAAKIALGRKLFYDRRLALNGTFSCAMCHVPEQGFASNEQATAIGIEGRTVRRNAPAIYNTAYWSRLFHDGRESTLEQQVWGPLLAANEMGAPSVGYVIDKLKSIPDYAGLFDAAFGRGPSMETVGMALAAYERTLISADSPFDRVRFGHQPDALSRDAQKGLELFTGKAGCSACHTIGKSDALFTDQAFHNTGIGFRAAMKGESKRKVQVAPGTSFEMDPSLLASVSEPKPNDMGRYEITQDPADRWKYRTPGLRNVALTAPYMHDGSLATLEDVVEFYDRGGEPNETLDPRIEPLRLNSKEKAALVAFLKSLTGSNVGILVADGFAAPVGDPR